MSDYEEDEESQPRSPNTKWYIILGLILLGWYLFRAKSGLLEGMYQLDIASLLLFVGAGFIKLEDSDMKHRTRKFVGNGIHTTITNDPAKRIGGYAIFKAGGIDTWMWKMHGNDASIIAPINCLTNVGECVIANTRFVKVPPSDLPDAVREHLEDYNYPKPYYYGIPDASQLLNIPEAEELLTEIRHGNRENQMLKKQIRDLLSYKESYTEHQKRMAEMEGKPKKGVLEKIFG